MAIPQVGAVGLTITVTIKDQDQAPVNLSGVTAGTIYLRRPNGRVSAGTPAATPAAVAGSSKRPAAHAVSNSD